jgi:SPOR domain
MGLRNILVLFFSAMAITLVVLIIFFSMFFEHLNFSFNTRLPDTAPTIAQPGETPDDLAKAPEETFDPFSAREAELNVPSEAAKITAPPAPYMGAEADLPVTPEPKAEPSPSALPRSASSSSSTGANEQGNGGREGNQDGSSTMNEDGSPVTPNASPASEQQTPPPVRRPLPPVPRSAPTPPPALHPTQPPPSSSASASPSRALYRVYVAGFETSAQAQQAAARYSGLGLRPTVKSINGRTILQLGVFASRDTAQRTAATAGAAIEVLPQ